MREGKLKPKGFSLKSLTLVFVDRLASFLNTKLLNCQFYLRRGIYPFVKTSYSGIEIKLSPIFRTKTVSHIPGMS